MSNVYQQLIDLLPSAPLLTGVVLSTDGVTSVLSLLGGGTATVRGTAPIGQAVYHRGGSIEGQAAAVLPGGDIEV